MTYSDSWKVLVETMNLHNQHGQSKQKYLFLKNHTNIYASTLPSEKSCIMNDWAARFIIQFSVKRK